MTPCELLARVGFDLLNANPTPPRDEDDRESIAAAMRQDHQSIARLLRDANKPAEMKPYNGARWLDRIIDWPDRVPALKVWAGNMTLPKIIVKHVKAMGDEPIDDLFAFTAPLKGASGIDARSAPKAIDIGFSLSALDMAIEQRPCVELLAIVGLQSVPLISFGRHEVGVLHDGKLYRWPIEDRDGDYLKRWGDNMVRLEWDWQGKLAPNYK